MLNEISIICFLSVAKHRSFTKAAEEVFISRQAVSKKVLSLERRLGVKLFERAANGVALTAEGELYLEFFQNVARDFGALSEAVGKTSAPAVRLLVGYELGVIIDRRVIETVGEFKRRGEVQDIKIRRYEPQVIESRLLSGQLDIAFTTIPRHSKIYKEFPFIAMEYAEYVLVTSQNHPKVGERTSSTDFDGEQAVYWNMDNSDDIICRKNFDSAWSGVGVAVVPSIQCTSLSSAYTELLLGNAVMLCNAKNELCTLPGIITYPLPRRELFGCVWNPEAPVKAVEFAEAFRGFEMEAGGV